MTRGAYGRSIPDAGPAHPLVATICHNLGGLERARGRFARGGALGALFEERLGADHDELATTLYNLAAVHAGRPETLRGHVRACARSASGTEMPAGGASGKGLDGPSRSTT